MIILYGGAFNPPTLAHKKIINALLEGFNPKALIVMPVGDIYPKPGLIAFEHRKNMLKCYQKQADFVLSDFEQQSAFNGSISALEHFEALYQEKAYFVIGADNLKDIKTWVQYETLLNTYQFIVIDRDHKAKTYLEQLEPFKNSFTVVNLDLKERSTQIRENIELHKKDLDDCVYHYIKNHHLYEV